MLVKMLLACASRPTSSDIYVYVSTDAFVPANRQFK